MKIDVSFEMVDDCVKFTINGKENVISIERLLALSTEPCRETDDYENEISDLHNRLDIAEYDKERLREEVTVLEEKLKALSAEPCEDCISRKDAINAIKRTVATEQIKELKRLPSVQPKPKTGHWEQYGYSWEDKFKCSECGEEQPKILCGERIIGHWSDYCPNCGADMRESEEV